MYTGKNNILEKLSSESFGWKLKDNNMKYIRNIYVLFAYVYILVILWHKRYSFKELCMKLWNPIKRV